MILALLLVRSESCATYYVNFIKPGGGEVLGILKLKMHQENENECRQTKGEAYQRADLNIVSLFISVEEQQCKDT